ncbi:cytosolic phospholipase A2 zeta-like, partial [Acipenser oxyrinchus oxyrinchus]
SNEELEVEFELRECSELLDVRLRSSLCQEENHFLNLRRPLVAQALKKALGLKKDLDLKQVGWK